MIMGLGLPSVGSHDSGLVGLGPAETAGGVSALPLTRRRSGCLLIARPAYARTGPRDRGPVLPYADMAKPKAAASAPSSARRPAGLVQAPWGLVW